MSQTPDISVLIVTSQRSQKLHRVLTDLTQQSLPPDRFEVIVSDDGSHPPVKPGVMAFSDRLSLRVVEGPRRGPATARNRALPLINAPLLLFLNDDVQLVSPDLLARHVAYHATLPDHHQPTALMGAFVFSPSLRRDLFHRTVEDAGLIGTAAMTAGIPLPSTMFWTGQLSLPTAEVRAVGGFDPNFAAPKGDDVDLGYRLIHQRNMRLIYTEQTVTWHDHPHTIDDWWQRAMMIGEAQCTLAKKHCDPIFWPGGAATMQHPHAARARCLSQRPLIDELRDCVAWVERESIPTGTHRIDVLDRSFTLPEEWPVLLHTAVYASTLFFYQHAFWEAF